MYSEGWSQKIQICVINIIGHKKGGVRGSQKSNVQFVIKFAFFKDFPYSKISISTDIKLTVFIDSTLTVSNDSEIAAFTVNTLTVNYHYTLIIIK